MVLFLNMDMKTSKSMSAVFTKLNKKAVLLPGDTIE